MVEEGGVEHVLGNIGLSKLRSRPPAREHRRKQAPKQQAVLLKNGKHTVQDQRLSQRGAKVDSRISSASPEPTSGWKKEQVVRVGQITLLKTSPSGPNFFKNIFAPRPSPLFVKTLPPNPLRPPSLAKPARSRFYISSECLLTTLKDLALRVRNQTWLRFCNKPIRF